MMRGGCFAVVIAAASGLIVATARAGPDSGPMTPSHADHEAHARAPEASETGASATSPSSGSTTRFEAPAPGSYELPAIDRIGRHELLGISGLTEPLLAIGPGELALVSFVYLSCDEACPLSTALLHQLDRALAQDTKLARRVELVTVSFDPRRDGPQAMAELRDRMAPKGRWRFLTAKDEAALRPVLEDFGQDAISIPGSRNAPDALRHVLKVFLVDGSGAVRQIYSTGFLDLRLVLADLRTLLPTAP
jgi:protein SCO1